MTVCAAVFEPLEAPVAARGSSFGRGTSSHTVPPTPYPLLPTPYFAVIPATSARSAAMASAMKRLSSSSTVPA